MIQRAPLIAGNWKMFKTASQAKTFLMDLKHAAAGASGVEIMVAPPFTALTAAQEILAGSNVKFGAQNVFWEAEGAFTGEIAPAMLTDLGCTYVIIGHSERRQYFGETDETVNKKIAVAVKHNLRPVFCVGETEDERKSAKTFSVLDKQLQKGLQELDVISLADLVIAYEPVWAIGTGNTATSAQAEEVHAFLRTKLAQMLGRDFASQTRILYGGSVKPANIKELMAQDNIDGALVGGASLDVQSFMQIVKFNC